MKREKLETGYRETVQVGLDASGPSMAAKPAAFSKEQQKQPTILNGRPFEQTGPPVVLFHPVFGEFLQDIDNQNLLIPNGNYQLTEDFLWKSAEFYIAENARRDEIKETLGKLWGHIGSAKFGKNDCSSDGVLTVDVGNEVAYPMILEFKNEIGTGGSDPTLQLSLYYRGYWSQEDTKKIRDLCCCPTFGVAIAGPWMCILGAVLLDKAVVQPLTPFIPLTAADDRHLGHIARILEALRLAFSKLRTFYTALADSNADEQQRYFPHFRAFVDPTGTSTPFTYISQLTEERTRLVWKAKVMHDQRLIVVKFTRKYNNTAHTLCATNQLAPELLYVGNDAKLGGFHAVVMAYIDHQPLQPDEIQSLDSRRNIYNDVQRAITLLHNAQYVFADLRNPNILEVTRNGIPKNGAQLIDFDWCGIEDRDAYPLSMSRRIPWPDGVQPGGRLRKVHDLAWLKRLWIALKLEKDLPDPTAS